MHNGIRNNVLQPIQQSQPQIKSNHYLDADVDGGAANSDEAS